MAYTKKNYLTAFALGCAISLASLFHTLSVADYFTERETTATVCDKERVFENGFLVMYEVRTHNDRMSIIGWRSESNKALYEGLRSGSAYRFTHNGLKGRIKSILTATLVADQLTKACPVGQ